jgi:hypothetical protein
MSSQSSFGRLPDESATQRREFSGMSYEMTDKAVFLIGRWAEISLFLALLEANHRSELRLDEVFDENNLGIAL